MYICVIFEKGGTNDITIFVEHNDYCVLDWHFFIGYNQFQFKGKKGR